MKKRILCVLLSVLTVLSLFPVGLLSATAVAESFEVSAGSSVTKTINTASAGSIVNARFTFAQDGMTSGSATDGALLSINGRKIIRITSGSGLHVFQTDNPWYVSGTNTWSYSGENYPTKTVDVTLTFNTASGTVEVAYLDKSCTLSGFDFSTAITLKFGGADCQSLKITNYSYEIPVNTTTVKLVSEGVTLSETAVNSGAGFTLPYDTMRSGYHLVG